LLATRFKCWRRTDAPQGGIFTATRQQIASRRFLDFNELAEGVPGEGADWQRIARSRCRRRRFSASEATAAVEEIAGKSIASSPATAPGKGAGFPGDASRVLLKSQQFFGNCVETHGAGKKTEK